MCVCVSLLNPAVSVLFVSLFSETKCRFKGTGDWVGLRSGIWSSYECHNLVNSSFGGLGVACWPLVPKFAGSNLAEALGFFRAKKSSAPLPSEGK